MGAWAWMGLLGAMAQGAEPGAERIRAVWSTYNAHAVYPLGALSDTDVERLAEGKVAKIRQVGQSKDEPQRVIGLLVIEQPRPQLWLAARSGGGYDSVTSVKIDAGGSREAWYQFMDVPRPFTDRHWVIEVWDNLKMASKTDNLAWEHPWRLTDGGPELAAQTVAAGRAEGITAAMAERAIYVPVNNGAWMAIALDEQHTLFGFHAQSVVGGMVPDRLVADFAMMSLKKLMRGVESEGKTVLSTWDPDPTMVGGDGQPLIEVFVQHAAGAASGAAEVAVPSP